MSEIKFISERLRIMAESVISLLAELEASPAESIAIADTIRIASSAETDEVYAS